MTRPRDRRRAEHRETLRRAVLTVLSTTLPELTDAEIGAVLQTARASTGIALKQLADHLASHPDALVSGEPRCPTVVIRLTHTLHEAGHTVVVRPGCGGCGSLTRALPRFGPEGRLCQMCAVRASLDTCARCGRAGTRIAARRAEGRICFACYRVDAEVVEDCGRCGRRRMPVTRLADGKPLCLGCWTQPRHRCDLCGQHAPAKVNGPDGTICRDCYRSPRPRRRCDRCGRIRLLTSQALGDGTELELCRFCRLSLDKVCAGCAEIRPCRRYGPDGRWFCPSCQPKGTESCCRCGQPKRIHTRWPIGPLCATCHNTLLDTPSTCAHCQQIHVLVAEDDQGAAICGPCAGTGFDPRCVTCGRPGRHYLPDRCARCVLGDRVTELLSGPDGQVSSQLRPLEQALASSGSPRTLIAWLSNSPNARLLARLAADGAALSHEVLDQLPPGRHEFYVRQMLVHTGVLPERDDDLERLPQWLNTVLASRPDEHARLIRPFVHWFLLRRARRRAASRRQPATAGGYLRTRILVALDLLTWLDEQQLSLAQLDQPSLEAWLAAGNSSSYTIRYFLDWATARGLTRPLTVPTLPRQAPDQILDEADRWDLLQRCLTDETMPLDIRAAGALVLLFGLPLSRIRHLTIDQVHVTDTRSFLRTGRHPLLLPPRLAVLIHRLAETPLTRARLVTSGTASRWLFPGLTPGRPTTQTGIRDKLRDYNIDTRPARNAALISLAGELPSTVLADVLGLSTTTAVQWAALAGRDWAAYVAERVSADA